MAIDANKDSVLFRVIPVYANGTTVFTSSPVPGISSASDATENTEADYSPAVYVKANTRNFKPGRNGSKISHVTIHTTQGSYAGAISWLGNDNAFMSAHYIIRASD